MRPDQDFNRDDAVVMLSSIPERVADIVGGIDETRLRYRHGPAFPTLQQLVAHLAEAGRAVDALLNHACIDHLTELDVRGAIDPSADPAPAAAADDLLQDFARDRRRTVDLLRGQSDADWSRVIHDPGHGEMTLLDVCRMVATHEMGHLTQLRNLISVLPEPQDLGPLVARGPAAQPPA